MDRGKLVKTKQNRSRKPSSSFGSLVIYQTCRVTATVAIDCTMTEAK